jgi:hypothetical protein
MRVRAGNGGRWCGSALVRYSAAWLAAGALAVVLAAAALRAPPPAGDLASAPLEHTRLEAAARDSGCRLVADAASARVTAAVAAPAGVHATPPGHRALSRALQRGAIVFSYRADLDPDAVDDVESLQPSVPTATIVTPASGTMREAVTARAYRRTLACPHLDRDAVEALRLFRARYLGSGPESV